MKLMPTELDLTNYKEPITLGNLVGKVVQFKIDTEDYPTKIVLNSEQFKAFLYLFPLEDIAGTQFKGIPVEMKLPNAN
jgi:hypothetical protein